MIPRAVIDNLTDDQKSNQFLIVFPEGVPTGPEGATASAITNYEGGGPLSLSLRMDQTFDPPQRLIGTYELPYNGIKITRTKSLEESEKRFQLSFRLDQNWALWNTLNKWWNYIFDDEKQTFRDGKSSRVPMFMLAFGPQNKISQRFEYKGTRLISLKTTPFENNGSEPSRVESEFIYHRFDSLI